MQWCSGQAAGQVAAGSNPTACIPTPEPLHCHGTCCICTLASTSSLTAHPLSPELSPAPAAGTARAPVLRPTHRRRPAARRDGGLLHPGPRLTNSAPLQTQSRGSGSCLWWQQHLEMASCTMNIQKAQVKPAAGHKFGSTYSNSELTSCPAAHLATPPPKSLGGTAAAAGHGRRSEPAPRAPWACEEGRRDRERTKGRQQGDKAAAGAGCEAHKPDFAVPPSSCCLRVMLRQQRRQCSITNTLRDGSQPCASLQHCSTVTFQHSLTVCGAPATHPWPAARH